MKSNHAFVPQDANPPRSHIVKILRCGPNSSPELPLFGFPPYVPPRPASLEGTSDYFRELVDILGGPLKVPYPIYLPCELGGADFRPVVFVKNLENVFPELHHFLIHSRVKKTLPCPTLPCVHVFSSRKCWEVLA